MSQGGRAEWSRSRLKTCIFSALPRRYTAGNLTSIPRNEAFVNSAHPPPKLTAKAPKNGPSQNENRLPVPSLFSGVNSLLVSGRVSSFNYGYDCGSQYLQSLVGFFDKEKLTILAAMKSRSAHLNQTSIVGFNTVDGSEIQHSPVEVGS